MKYQTGHLVLTELGLAPVYDTSFDRVRVLVNGSRVWVDQVEPIRLTPENVHKYIPAGCFYKTLSGEDRITIERLIFVSDDEGLILVDDSCIGSVEYLHELQTLVEILTDETFEPCQQ